MRLTVLNRRTHDAASSCLNAPVKTAGCILPFTVHPRFTRATFQKMAVHPISLVAFKSIPYLYVTFFSHETLTLSLIIKQPLYT
jgi:hypothetical protein